MRIVDKPYPRAKDDPPSDQFMHVEEHMLSWWVLVTKDGKSEVLWSHDAQQLMDYVSGVPGGRFTYSDVFSEDYTHVVYDQYCGKPSVVMTVLIEEGTLIGVDTFTASKQLETP